jgi:FkbM family methyltransferase
LSERELTIIPMLLGKGGLCLDVGAAQGSYSVEMLKCGRRVLAFEPLFDIYAEDLGGLLATQPNLSVLPYAASNRAGRTTIRVPQFAGKWQPQRASISQDFSGVPHQDFNVPLVTIDSLDLVDVGFIKVDVEGNEINVILGALGLIHRDRPVLLIEMEQRHIPGDLIIAIRVIEALGYRSHVYLDKGLVDRDTLDLQEIQRDGLRRLDPETYLNNIVFLPTIDWPRNPGWIAPFLSGGEASVMLWGATLDRFGIAFGLGEERADLPASELDGRFQRMWNRAEPLAPAQLLRQARNLNLGRIAYYYDPAILPPNQTQVVLRGLAAQGAEVRILVAALGDEAGPLAVAQRLGQKLVFASAELAAKGARLGLAGTVLPQDQGRAVDLLFA